jgi:hypothetical protein
MGDMYLLWLMILPVFIIPHTSLEITRKALGMDGIPNAILHKALRFKLNTPSPRAAL